MSRLVVLLVILVIIHSGLALRAHPSPPHPTLHSSSSSLKVWNKILDVATSPFENNRRKETNEIVKVVEGIRHKRLGGSDIIVSELGLGTQRWVSGIVYPKF